MDTAIAIEDGLAGFTPARRRISTINTRQHHAETEVEWTSTRCNRLLRALTSRVAVLTKELSRFQPATAVGTQASNEKVIICRKRSTFGVGDTEWSQARKRVKRTYSGRGGGRTGNRTASGPSRTIRASGEGKPLAPGEVSVPTPVLNRARNDTKSSQICSVPLQHQESLEQDPNRTRKRPKTKNEEGYFQLSKMMRVIRRRLPAFRYTIYEGIYNGLETLLKATASSLPNTIQKGPRSLKSMCLIVIPQYIAQEKALLDNQLEEMGGRSAISNRDISTEIYDDLEKLGCSGRGYKHLRIIVRSHGVQVISDAIHTGLLDPDFCDILIALCNHMEAREEGERLLSSLLLARSFPGPKSVFTRFEDDEKTRPLLMLWNHTELKNRSSFQYRQLSKVISNKLLPISWVSTKEFGQVWTRVIQAFSLNVADPEAINFVETTISLLAQMEISTHRKARCRSGGDDALADATKQTFSSLLTTLTSIVILRRRSESLHNSHQPELTSTTTIEHFLLRSTVIHWKLFPQNNSQGVLLLLANIVLGDYASPGAMEDIGHLLMYLRDIEGTPHFTCRDSLIAFLCSVARCCGRGTSSLGLSSLEDLHLLLESIAKSRDKEDANLLFAIIVDSAHCFAQQIPERIHLEYAARIETKFPSLKDNIARNGTPARAVGVARGGFRWEEGISEWVTATPTANNGVCCENPAYSLPKPSGCDNPFRPSIRRSLRKKGGQDCLEQSQASPGAFALVDTDEVCDVDEEIFKRSSQGCLSPQTFCGDSEDELTDNQEIQSWSSSPGGSERSDELNTSGVQDDDVFSSETLASGGSSSCSSMSGRQYVDRAPRLRRRVLRHSLQWQLFDEESDDELSFQSTPPSQGEEIMRDTTNKSGCNLQRGVRTNNGHQRSLNVQAISLLSESEDELCI